MLKDMNKFISNMVNYDYEKIQPAQAKAIEKYLEQPGMTVTEIEKKSKATAFMLVWA